PGSEKEGPCLWISVVGKDALWPLRRIRLDEVRPAADPVTAAAAAYVFPVEPPDRKNPVAAGATPGGAVFLPLLRCGAVAPAALCALPRARARTRSRFLWLPRALRRLFAPPSPRGKDDDFYHRRFVLASVHATAVVITFLLTVLVARVRGSDSGGVPE